jgi:hypothetical protein
MENLLDYVSRAGAAGFDELPLTEVDLACFTQLSYLPYAAAFETMDRPSLREAGDALAGVEADKVYNIFLRKRLELMRAMMEAPRYAEIILSDYIREIDPESEKQFCALTLTLPRGERVISFEGTDSTLVGWKEDFNMAFSCPVPAQVEALVYLARAAELFPLPIRVGGHSKGGNLAVYAAAYAPAEIQDRILAVYSNDGPGMDDVTFQSLGYIQIVPKLRSIVPEFSIIGMLLHQHLKYQVVKSCASGLSQHDPFSWCVQRESFEDAGHLKAASIKMDEILDTWLFDMSTDDRMALIDTLYAVLNATKALTVEDLGCCKLKNAGAVLSVLRHMDGSSRHLVWEKLGGLVSVAVGGGKAEQEKAEPEAS